MEQTDQFNSVEENPSYWGSIGVAALIFAIITFVLQIALGYVQMSGNSGWVFTSIAGVVVCLIGAFGGMMAVWHYANEYDITFNFGKGALIGFLTGVAIVIISIILMKLWLLVDPDYQQQILEATMERFEEMDVPEESLGEMRANVESRFTITQQLLWGIPITGILNLLTGLLGVQLFAKEEEEF